MARAPTVTEKNSEFQYFLEEPIYITNMTIVDDPRDPKPKTIRTNSVKAKANVKEESTDTISDEQLNSLTGEFLEAMNTQEGIEFLEKMQTERRHNAYDKLGRESARIFEAMNKRAAESTEDKQSDRQPRRGRRAARKESEKIQADDEESDEKERQSERKRRRSRKGAPEDSKEANVAATKDDKKPSVSSNWKAGRIDSKALDAKQKLPVPGEHDELRKAKPKDKDSDNDEQEIALTMDDDEEDFREEAANDDDDDADAKPKEVPKLSRNVEAEQGEAGQRRNRRKPKKRYRPNIDHQVKP